MNQQSIIRRMLGSACALILTSLAGSPDAGGQTLFESRSETISPEIESMYVRGLNYLQGSQGDRGSWPDGMGAQPGVVGLVILAFLAHGEDPNTGPYALIIRRGLDFILQQQNKTSGYIGSSMYNHGFATLALAEIYGMIDDERIGKALEAAVQLILRAQEENPFGAWRYSPTSRDADTTVSGAQLVALFAARNAGLGVPEEAIEKGLQYYIGCQSDDGGFGYTTPGGSNAPRTAIGALVFALAKKKATATYRAAMTYLNSGEASSSQYYHYYLYYASQAYFRAGTREWEEWNQVNVKVLRTTQQEDGSWESNYGASFGTAASLLSLALNYRLLPIYER